MKCKFEDNNPSPPAKRVQDMAIGEWGLLKLSRTPILRTTRETTYFPQMESKFLHCAHIDCSEVIPMPAGSKLIFEF